MIGDQHRCKNGVVENEKLIKKKKKLSHHVYLKNIYFHATVLGIEQNSGFFFSWYMKYECLIQSKNITYRLKLEM